MADADRTHTRLVEHATLQQAHIMLEEAMPVDPMEFAERVGVELSTLLGRRAQEELLELSGEAQFSGAPGASLLCVAQLLRAPVERGAAPATVAAIAARQLELLLTQLEPHTT